ncbi:MAG: DUF2721 domain-containing protein [Alphaproteobacteria bacterium]|jgi:hypothetical protein|nr:DUF2721 domain-containing protein [Alphaproteobacteria bacterium]|tara:strand:- start:7379 stop:7804 length:426 start_codon:yes stop_codon:yes gene_type:complete
MNNVNFWYPALLFPAIPLMMISFGNRYSTLAALIRKIHDSIIIESSGFPLAKTYMDQLKVLTVRLQMVRAMQTLSATSFLANLLTIFLGYMSLMDWALTFFGFAVLIFSLAIVIFIIEIQFSVKALASHLADLQDSKLFKK